MPQGQTWLDLETGRTTAAQQHQMPRPLVHQPLCGTQTKATDPARDQVSRFATELQSLCRLGTGFHQVLDGVAIGHDDLADLTGLLHVAECFDHLIGVELAVRQRVQDALLEQLHHVPEQASGQVRTLAHQLVSVDAEVADVVAERAQADTGVLVEVALAQFQEAAERFKDSQVTVDRLTCQRIEHDVDTTSARHCQHLIGICQRAGIENVLDAQQAQEVALFVTAGGGVNLGTAPFGNLNRGNTDTTRSTVDQDFFARFQTCQVMQRVVHGEERTRNSRSRFKRHACRDFRHRVGVGHQTV